jgi:cell division septum initiation protein DivIVA
VSEPNRQYHQALSANRKLLAENARLKAEVERLTKELENTDCMFAMASAFARDWNAAKEAPTK